MHVLDLGNTRAHAAVCSRGPLTRLRSIPYDRLAAFRPVGTVVYAGVNPPMERRLDRAFGALKLGREVPVPMPNRTRRPERVGTDRLANAVAAWERCHRACVVVDLGTAVTLDVVNGRGEFVGGMIAPGVRLQGRALHEHTALLPEVAPAGRARAIGRDTEEAIRAGIRFGIAGLVRAGVEAIRRELGVKPRVFGTGGDSPLFRDAVDEVVDYMTLEGVALAARKHGIV